MTPSWGVRPATAEAPDAFVLTLPGPPRRRYMAGAEVQGMYVLGPLPGAALTVCLVTCGDTACIGVTSTSAVADLAGLAECLVRKWRPSPADPEGRVGAS